MTSRQAGKRVAAVRRKRTVKQSGTHRARRKEDSLRPGERRLLIQLVLCGSVFVLLVAVKILLPARMEQLQVRLGGAMEQNMDVRAVFSAVGRAFSGESEVITAANEVYRAVFHAEEEAVETSCQVPAMESAHALDELQSYRPVAADTEPEMTGTGASDRTEVSALSYVLYSDQNLPDQS